MEKRELNIIFFGLSITSSWGNGHATTFRSLIKELHRLGHKITFFERDVPWYAGNRDMPDPPFCKTILYSELEDLEEYREMVADADINIVGSYVPDGIEVGEWVLKNSQQITAFYDIDTPVTMANLAKGKESYINPHLISRYDIFFSFSAGRTLEILENEYHSPQALPLHCSVDTDLYYPENTRKEIDLGYMGTYSDDRQPPLQSMLIDAAHHWPEGKFVVAGPQYPANVEWPENVKRFEHLAPSHHRHFYNQQRFTLNVTRVDMIKAGHSPSVRLFEAAACGIPIISDWWEGLDSYFKPEEEILISANHEDTLSYLKELDEPGRKVIGEKARKVILKNHTSRHRALELEQIIFENLKISV